MMLNGKDTWVVIADSTQCKIYQYWHHPEKINLIKSLNYPDNHLKDMDMVTDKQGHCGTSNYVNSDPKKIHIDDFSREIAMELDKERKKNGYKHLILISLPHMHGRLNSHMSKHVRKMIDLEIDKDVIHYKEPQLLHFLHQQTHMI